ncbi:MAG: hypothetical protein ACLQDL_10330 [Spirochaetia bacterium]
MGDRSCPDPDVPGARVHYALSLETYGKLQSLVAFMGRNAGTKQFAMTLQALLEEAECFIEE